ncbi:TRAP transporter substrate-binding protein [Chelativorans sp. Marseille-P2723]|uniref:TRAP transporter substrate-binding protein n=1 Tax=Chelativorans sp. Marseille-P2723 TaxID=2709133 RepID=UPI00156D957B|nr:TRAP transporter substrate-binding protein [Chelativorans sp. Marseille-P2723]
MIRKLAALGAAMMMATGLAVAQEYSFTLGHAHPESGSFHQIALKLQDELAKSGVELIIYPDASLGGELKMVQSIRNGAVDFTIVSQPTIENSVPEFRVLSLPYIYEDMDHASAVLHGPLGRQFLDILKRYDIVGFDWGPVYERSVAGTKSIGSVDDMAGLKIRVVQSPGFVKAYEALGAQPTAMAYGELFLALQNGVVDATELAPGQILSDGFGDIVTHYSTTRANYIPSLLLMSAGKFESLPSDVQEKIREAAEAAMKFGAEYVRSDDTSAIEKMKERGVVFADPDLAPFMEKARASWDEILGEEAAKPEIQNFLAEAEKLRKND